MECPGELRRAIASAGGGASPLPFVPGDGPVVVLIDDVEHRLRVLFHGRKHARAELLTMASYNPHKELQKTICERRRSAEVARGMPTMCRAAVAGLEAVAATARSTRPVHARCSLSVPKWLSFRVSCTPGMYKVRVPKR